MSKHVELVARLEAALSRDGKPRGDHMAEVFALMASTLAASDNEKERLLSDVYDLASRCIANETKMFTELSAVTKEVIAILQAQSVEATA